MKFPFSELILEKNDDKKGPLHIVLQSKSWKSRLVSTNKLCYVLKLCNIPHEIQIDTCCQNWSCSDKWQIWMWFKESNLYFYKIWASCQNGPLARYMKSRVRMRRECPGTFSPPPRVSDPDMHHGTCVMHVLLYMPGSLISGFLWSQRRGKTIPAFPAHAQAASLRIW